MEVEIKAIIKQTKQNKERSGGQDMRKGGACRAERRLSGAAMRRHKRGTGSLGRRGWTRKTDETFSLDGEV